MQKKNVILSKTDKTLEEAIFEIGLNVIAFNREHGWEDDNYNDIVYEINQQYELDGYERSLLDDFVRKFLETI